MKILHIIFVPRYSGAEILVRDLAKQHTAQGQQVAVASLMPAEDDFMREVESSRKLGVRWFIPDRPLTRMSRILQLRQWIKEYHPDLVVAHSAIPALDARLAMLTLKRPPVVTVLHAVNDYDNPKLRLLEKILQSKTSAVISVSRTAADNYRQNVAQPKRLEVIENGVDVERFEEAVTRREAIRATLSIPESSKVVIQVGRIATVKRQHLTLRTLIPLLREQPQLQVWFIGLIEDRNYFQTLQQHVASSEVADQLRFLGPRSDIPELVAAADLLVMPSEREAFPINFIEGLASGIPIIATNLAVIEFARDWEGITLLDPERFEAYHDALQVNLAEPQRYSRDVLQYSIKLTASRYLTLFEEAIEATQSPKSSVELNKG